jgi:hypothetical protein
MHEAVSPDAAPGNRSSEKEQFQKHKVCLSLPRGQSFTERIIEVEERAMNTGCRLRKTQRARGEMNGPPIIGNLGGASNALGLAEKHGC